jgi:hypothetical protein
MSPVVNYESVIPLTGWLQSKTLSDWPGRSTPRHHRNPSCRTMLYPRDAHFASRSCACEFWGMGIVHQKSERLSDSLNPDWKFSSSPLNCSKMRGTQVCERRALFNPRTLAPPRMNPSEIPSIILFIVTAEIMYDCLSIKRSLEGINGYRLSYNRFWELGSAKIEEKFTPRQYLWHPAIISREPWVARAQKVCFWNAQNNCSYWACVAAFYTNEGLQVVLRITTTGSQVTVRPSFRRDAIFNHHLREDKQTHKKFQSEPIWRIKHWILLTYEILVLSSLVTRLLAKNVIKGKRISISVKLYSWSKLHDVKSFNGLWLT